MRRSTPKATKSKASKPPQPHQRAQRNPSRSLLDLPAELWIQICRLAATPSDPLSIRLDAHRLQFGRLLNQPPITRTCRAIRAETLQHFYNTAIIRIEQRPGRAQLKILKRWLEAIGDENRRNIRALPFAWLEQYRVHGLEVLAVPLKVHTPPGCKVLGEEDDGEDIIASVRRYVLGPEPISI